MPTIGKAGAAGVACSLLYSFSSIKLSLVVGICGGAPTGIDKNEILLGDIVISTGIVQFDYGRRYPNSFKRKDTLNENLGRPNTEIRAFLHKIRGKAGRKRLMECSLTYLQELCQKEGFESSRYPGADKDKLYEPGYHHKHQSPIVCDKCTGCESAGEPLCDTAIILVSLLAAVMNLSQKEHCLELSYVAVSRVRTISRIVFEKPFGFEHFTHVARSGVGFCFQE